MVDKNGSMSLYHLLMSHHLIMNLKNENHLNHLVLLLQLLLVLKKLNVFEIDWQE